MKKVVFKFVYVLLCTSYLVSSVSFVLPYLEYKMNYKYISTNLCEKKDEVASCCKGKCHIKKRVAEETDKTTSNNSKNSVNEKGSLNLHLASASNLNLIPALSKLTIRSLTCELNSTRSEILTPPPKITLAK